MNHDEQIAAAADQAARWNGPSARAWIDNQDVLDRMFQPFEDLLVRCVNDLSGTTVLDIGCGTGSTTLALHRAVTPRHGRAVGADISAPMIATAQARGRKEGAAAEFVCGDVQTHDFPAASFDTVVSRFGVMFFGDPIAAFGNIRRASAAGANLRMIVWRSEDDNSFMTAAERTAAPLLPDLPDHVPGAPGQFAFADPDHVRTILDSAGWGDVSIDTLDVECTMTRTDLSRYIRELGPVAAQLRVVDDATRDEVLERLSAAFEPFIDDDGVRFTAACWMVSAHAK